ncbi:hypothetical protein KM043_005853 [Ampulex compressa]|nr:hypothetical protein KM043_005853 [Ampulex compressa]
MLQTGGAKLLLLLFIGSILISAYGVDASYQVSQNIKYGNFSVLLKDNTVLLTIQKNDGSVYMINTLHTKDPDGPYGFLNFDSKCGLGNICVNAGSESLIVIRANNNSESISVIRSSSNPDAELTDCYQFEDGTQWFGGPQMRYQHWPIQNMYYEEEPYLPTHPTNMGLSERYWLSSKGIYIFVDETDPLFLDQNNYKDKHLCLIAKNKAPYRYRRNITLKYEIGVFPDAKQSHQNVVKRYLGKPKGHPNDRMIRHPVWSTWARYKANVSDDVVRTFADEILHYNFSNSQLEIDDNWETCYGSAEFDKTKFPNITALVRDLKRKGFRVTLWIHPFINEGCEPAYSTALRNSYFAKSIDGRVHTTWWQGKDAAAIDFTNPKAVEWWIARLKKIEQYGIDSFKFDAGEVSWLPQVASLTGPLDLQPGIYTMIDKDTRWTWNNGLPTLITTLLQMNLNGYVHVLPDMIGGNGYLNNMLNGTVYPPKELFIRWLQTNVFMPSLQYSFVPWDFDNETIAISRKFTNLHAAYTPAILAQMRQSIANGAPLNPPIWWVDPNDAVAHQINDEYLLGENLLVAPVIAEGAVSRDVYLPRGRWVDGNNRRIYNGPIWLRDYPAPLDILPYFLKTA